MELICGGAMLLTDVVFWLILYSFLTSKDYKLNFMMAGMYSFNLVFFLGEWKDIVNNGIKIHNAEVKRQGRKPTTWKNCVGIPVQQISSIDCGYFIMRYMKDIVEDKNLEFFSKWEKKGKATYTQQHIDEVRNEWAKFVVKTYM